MKYNGRPAIASEDFNYVPTQYMSCQMLLLPRMHVVIAATPYRVGEDVGKCKKNMVTFLQTND